MEHLESRVTTKQPIIGQVLKYTGRGFRGFDADFPFVKFLGYDCSGWSDVWVDYENRAVLVNLQDIEVWP